jgi:hypothetical protein
LRPIERRRQLTFIVTGSLVAAPVLWALGAPRYGLVCFIVAVMCGVMVGGPTEQRISPSRGVPITVASSLSFLVSIASFDTISLVMAPYPRQAFGAAVWGVAMLAAWVITRRWPRADPPLPS